MIRSKAAGAYLKALRMSRSYGLRQFAEMIGEHPSNLSAIENATRPFPQSKEKLCRWADALALAEGSTEWDRFFQLTKLPGRVIAPLEDLTDKEFFPVMCRTLGSMQPTVEEIDLLAKYLLEHRKKQEHDSI
jgi:transcriptional regulator with XRE-family HTH domain